MSHLIHVNQQGEALVQQINLTLKLPLSLSVTLGLRLALGLHLSKGFIVQHESGSCALT